ncbi:MAG TPA: metal-sensing transcriptional repressor [Solirubrobacterales bacterium]|nr:metal-sensing transcriptional repressor [Solirubrobacterales bacterium]
MALEDYVDEILASGFPGLSNLGDRALRLQLDGYSARVVDRDFIELGHQVRNPAGLRRWMTAYAAATATTTSFEKIRAAATGDEGEQLSKDAARPYRTILERLWILDPVPAWQPTRRHLSRLSAASKHHLVDPALAARLLGATREALLEDQELGPPIRRDGTLLGALFESLVTLCVRVYAQSAEATVGHLRTFSGSREIDLIVEGPAKRVVAIEVKLKRTIRDDDVNALHWLQGQIGDELLDAVVVNTRRSRLPANGWNSRSASSSAWSLIPPGGICYSPPMVGYREDKEKLLKRLARVEGQVRGVSKMVEEERYCIDVLTQIGAIQAALDKVALGLLDEHTRHCVVEADGDERVEKMDELMAAVGRLVKR